MPKRSRNHIIQKQVLEIHFEDISDGFALRNAVSEVFHTRLLPRMEMLFDEFADEQHRISFDVLDIDCTRLSGEHWEQELIENTIRSLRKELLAANETRIEYDRPADKNDDELLYFLKQGRLPWNSSATSMEYLEQLPLTKEWVEKLIALVQTDSQVAERLAYSFPEKFITNVIGLLAKEDAINQPLFPDVTIPRQQKLANQSHLIKTLCSKKPSPLAEVERRQAQQRDQEASKETPGPTSKKNEEPEAIYIHNAGLVILHPCLPGLFETCGLISNGSWAHDMAAHTALIVLEYLAGGNDDYPEFNLPFNKILCGLLQDEVAKIQEPLSASIKEECDNLLRAVIEHWAALKNTGIDALRETFLRRFGKLTKANNGWLLQVEQKAVDVLLSRLPWGIGTIRLPWMNNILYTEWC